HGREGLVHLDPFHVADRLAGLLQRLRARVRGRAREPRELVGDVTLRNDRGEWLQPASRRELLRADDDTRRAIVYSRRVAGCDRAFGIHHGLQPRELLERRVAANALVGPHLSDRDDLLGEEALVLCSCCALVRSERPAVLLLARDAELARDARGLL